MITPTPMTPRISSHPLMQALRRWEADGHTAYGGPASGAFAKRHSFEWSKADRLALMEQGHVAQVGDFLARPAAAVAAAWCFARLAGWGMFASVRRRALKLGPPPAGATPSQVAAWHGLQHKSTAALTGGPGTGKSWLIARLVEALSADKKSVMVMSPTAKAASNLAPYLAPFGVTPTTIHRGFGYMPGDDPKKACRVYADVVIVEEASMVDEELMSVVVRGTAESALWLVGDPDQLPPVGAGRPFHDGIRCDILPTFHLSEVKRQAAGSGIGVMAGQFKSGGPLAGPWEGVKCYSVPDANLLDKAKNLYCGDFLKAHGRTKLEELLMLSPVRDPKFEGSIVKLNEEIARELDPLCQPVTKLLQVGDRVIFRYNSSSEGFINGQLGWIRAYNTSAYDHSSALTIEADDGQKFVISNEDVKESKARGYDALVERAYATTVHKAQGSEARWVAILLDRSAAHCYTQNLVYTALTRAKEGVFFLGATDLLERAMLAREVRHTALVALNKVWRNSVTESDKLLRFLLDIPDVPGSEPF